MQTDLVLHCLKILKELMIHVLIDCLYILYQLFTLDMSILADCSSLNHPLNGFVSTPEGTVYNATAVYSCEEGYQLTDGSSTRMCVATETWTGSTPRCIKRSEILTSVVLVLFL